MYKINTLTLAGAALLLAACGGGSSSNQPEPDQPGLSGNTYAAVSGPRTHNQVLDGTTATGGSATLRVHLTDAPNRDIEVAEVTISSVSVHSPGGPPYTVLSEPRTLDLLEYQNGLTTLLGEIDLEAGKYTQLRLEVSEGRVVSEGEEFSVFVPSGTVRINRPFDVCADGEVDIVVDFDARESLRYNPGKNEFRMQPVVKIDRVDSQCPDQPNGNGEESDKEYDGPLGWLAIVLPPVELDLFDSLVTTVDDIRVHDQGIGQVSVFAESYAVDLLEDERQLVDEETGEVTQTLLIPAVEVPAGSLNQVRLLFQPIIATDTEGRTITIKMPAEEDSEADGLKFFDEVQVCEGALTVMQWDLDLSSASLDFEHGEPVIVLHPVVQQVETPVVCQAIEDDEEEEEE